MGTNKMQEPAEKKKPPNAGKGRRKGVPHHVRALARQTRACVA